MLRVQCVNFLLLNSLSGLVFPAMLSWCALTHAMSIKFCKICGQEVLLLADGAAADSADCASPLCSMFYRLCLIIMLAAVAGIGHYLMACATCVSCVAGANGEGHSAGFPPAE